MKNKKIIIGIMLFLLLVAGVADVLEWKEPVEGLERASARGEEKDYEYYLSGRDEAGNEVIKKEPLTVKVEPLTYTSEEIEEAFEEARVELAGEMCNGNDTLDEVRSSVKLPESCLEERIQVEWELEPSDVMDSCGEIVKRDLSENGLLVTAYATLSLLDYDGDCVEKRCEIIPIRVYPPKLSRGERLLQDVEQDLEQRGKKEKTLELPQSKDGIKLSWKRKREHYFIKLALFEGLILGLLYLLQFEKNQEQRKELERQLLGEYPGFVGKFTVLVGAGMTVSTAFTRMVEQDQKSEEKRLVYTELALALQRIREGESERVAYQKFADAMGLPEYRRFIRLLLQQMKTGGSGFLEEIRYESELAYRNHRNHVKRIGEEAGTKMLFPMILMLGIVMAIVLAPALMTFEI